MSGRKIPYPWGRIRPERRIEELEAMILKLSRQKGVLELQLQDSLRKIDMSISALTNQIEAAKGFAKEDDWSALRERIYALTLRGVDALSMIQGMSITQAESLIGELEKDVPEEVKSSKNDDEFLNSSIDEIDNLFSGD